MQWLKSPPGPWAGDFPPFLQRFAAFTPFKSLLQFFEFECQLETKPTLFGNIFTALRNNFRWLKSPPGPWARFYSVLRRVAPFTSLMQFFEFVCQLKTKPSLFGKVFTALRNNFRWLKTRQVSGHVIIRYFYSVLRIVAPFKSLLHFFSFVCQLKTKPTLFGNVFTVLRNNFWSYWYRKHDLKIAWFDARAPRWESWGETPHMYVLLNLGCR